MDKRAKKEEKILKDFQKISKEMAPKPQYFKNIILKSTIGSILGLPLSKQYLSSIKS